MIDTAKKLTPKERLAIPPQEMPTQDPEVRKHNMKEVALGYTEEQAHLESLRCLHCKNAPCVPSCPVSDRYPGFIAKIAEGGVCGGSCNSKKEQTCSLLFAEEFVRRKCSVKLPVR